MTLQKNKDLVITFAILLVLTNLLVIIPAFNILRPFLRMSSYLLGFFYLFLILLRRPKTDAHPAKKLIIPIFIILLLSLFNPDTISPLAGIAAIALYLSILSPLLWIRYLKVDMGSLRKLIFFFFVFHALSSLFGVLQVYQPEKYTFEVPYTYDESTIQSRKITLASGERIFRPMGLTNTPGGAATSGFYVVICGLGIIAIPKKLKVYARILIAVSMAIGLCSIYLSQVRVMLVATAFFVLIFPFLLFWFRKFKPVFIVNILAISIFISAFFWAVGIGGDVVIDRVNSLFAAKPSQVYYENRGRFLEETFTHIIWEYPWGAGLGRWGMVDSYFNKEPDAFLKSLWAEIQWTGWVYDGGIPLVILYTLMILIAIKITFNIAKIRLGKEDTELKLWAMFVFAYNISIFAITFNSPVFMSQLGMEFWLINATLYAAYRQKTKEL